MRYQCNAPAKIILTGEHAVLNAVPALSLALSLNTNCEVGFVEQNNPSFTIELLNYKQKYSLPFVLWEGMAIEIESRFQQYLNRSLPIQTVLKRPLDLIVTCLYHFHKKHRIKHGDWQIKISGHGMHGRGLGSSASVIVALLSSLYNQLGINVDDEELLQLAITIENRQHGQSSGLDPATILRGGGVKFQSEHPIEVLANRDFPIFIIDTGIAESSTGQAVNFVQQHFAKNHPIWQEFVLVSNLIEQAWLEENTKELQIQVKQNQKLLEQLGVVPNKVKNFINSLDDCVGKICGSGAIEGDSAGIILCIGKAPISLCEEYGYNILPIKLNTKGTYCEVVD